MACAPPVALPIKIDPNIDVKFDLKIRGHQDELGTCHNLIVRDAGPARGLQMQILLGYALHHRSAYQPCGNQRLQLPITCIRYLLPLTQEIGFPLPPTLPSHDGRFLLGLSTMMRAIAISTSNSPRWTRICFVADPASFQKEFHSTWKVGCMWILIPARRTIDVKEGSRLQVHSKMFGRRTVGMA